MIDVGPDDCFCLSPSPTVVGESVDGMWLYMECRACTGRLPDEPSEDWD